MLREGDRVTLFANMGKEGTVVSTRWKSVKAMLVGGTLSKQLIVKVHHDSGEIFEYRSKDLMKLHDRR